MPRLSISYRRADSDAITGRLFDRLTDYYGRKSVFRDIDNIPLGTDFREHIGEALTRSDILLAIVGPEWLSASQSGRVRLQDEDDYVRIEIETALQRRIPVIPVLIGKTEMPKAKELPESLRDFAYRNAVRVDTGKDFEHHVNVLIGEMNEIMGWRPPRKGRGTRMLAMTAGLVIALLAAGTWAYFSWWSRPAWTSVPYLGVAYREIGQREIEGRENNPRILQYISAVTSTEGVEDDKIDWASPFVEWCLNQVGISGPKNLDPRAWQQWGRELTEPQVGAIGIFKTGAELWHVSFVVGVRDDTLHVLGGNQSDSVRISVYRRELAETFRMPPSR
jgi:uncharacterized protein (TIGR02594 family)